MNSNGTPLWVEREKGGKFCRIDAVKNAWFRLMTKLKEQGIVIEKPLKALRKTCPSLLQHHQIYGQYAQYFLGHAPHSVADRSYIARPGGQLDDAIRWLGEQLGIDPSPLPAPVQIEVAVEVVPDDISPKSFATPSRATPGSTTGLPPPPLVQVEVRQKVDRN